MAYLHLRGKWDFLPQHTCFTICFFILCFVDVMIIHVINCLCLYIPHVMILLHQNLINVKILCCHSITCGSKGRKDYFKDKNLSHIALRWEEFTEEKRKLWVCEYVVYIYIFVLREERRHGTVLELNGVKTPSKYIYMKVWSINMFAKKLISTLPRGHIFSHRWCHDPKD